MALSNLRKGGAAFVFVTCRRTRRGEEEEVHRMPFIYHELERQGLLGRVIVSTYVTDWHICIRTPSDVKWKVMERPVRTTFAWRHSACERANIGVLYESFCSVAWNT